MIALIAFLAFHLSRLLLFITPYPLYATVFLLSLNLDLPGYLLLTYAINICKII